MSGILVYALHYEGAINKNSLGAVSEGARLAAELGTECHAIVVGDKAGLPTTSPASLGNYGATKVFRVEGPEGLAQPVVDAMAKVARTTATSTRCSAAACSASRSAPASRPGSTPASAWRSPRSSRRRQARRRAARSSRTRRCRDVHYRFQESA